MGKNNRARRAAKARHRRTEHRPGHEPGTPADPPRLPPRELAAGLFELAAERLHAGDDVGARQVVRHLGDLPPDLVDREIERRLLVALAAGWDRGWQPTELVRQARRATTAAGSRLASLLVLADHGRRSADTVHPSWAAQVDALTAASAPVGDRWFSTWSRSGDLQRSDALTTAVALLHAILGLGPIAELLPPPGRATRRVHLHPAAGRHDDPMLAKVRALLAQAESTSFPGEAEAFTAKAQELMTRHAIDRALLDGPRPGEHPVTRRLPIEDPYVDAKSYLLQVVAEHSRCRAVFHDHYAFSSVVGFEQDLDATELLFTSLLVQAQVALTAEARDAPAGARSRSRSFRSSFLVAYAVRVGQRLAEINQEVAAAVEAETSRSALPVLAARRQEVDDALDEQFGALRTSRVSAGWDRLGGIRGGLAADRARLAFGDLADTAS